MTLNREIEQYLEKHYLLHFNKKVNLKVTHLVDRGFYYQFHLWKDNVVSIGETVLKDDLIQKL
ncbi:hypothetical protein GCM10007190_08130 [Macrococcus hajekii]|nr:hypothetical protein GCM10007190_08130 [Macrococcus hajekii]